MSRVYGETPKKQKQWRKEGRGCNEGEIYKPWLTIHDFPSEGNVHRIPGIKIPRDHHLFSNPERDYFYIIEFCDSVVDIREQYPLFELEETIAIANEIGIEHPRDKYSDEYKMITTDFLMTIRKNNIDTDIARTIKPFDMLMDERIIEKFEIERRYWKQKGVDWGIVTEREINERLASNIGNLRPSFNISKLDGYKEIPAKNKRNILNEFVRTICGNQIVVRNFTDDFDKKMSLPVGTSLSLFKHLVITKVISVELDQDLEAIFDKPQVVNKYKPQSSEALVG